MARTLLSAHPRVATGDLEVARTEVAEQFCPHHLGLTPGQTGLDVVHNAASVGRIGLNYLRYGAEVRITPGLFETFYLLQVPLAGTARVKVGDRVVASDRRYASLPSPTEPVDMVWSADCEQLLVYLPRDAVEELAGTHEPGGRSASVVFDPLVDLSSPAVRSFLRLVNLVREELEQGTGVLGGPGGELAASHFEQVLLAGLLTAQPSSAPQSRARSAPGSQVVTRALAAVEERPEHPWRVADLAAEVGVSARTLQDAFQRERGSTPLSELRRVRLERARADLLDAVTGESVTDVATRWGFFHLGRFAAAYREAYGETPSQTLDR